MGRKGVSKRKPKQAKNVKGSSSKQQVAGAVVQDLLKNKETPLNNDDTNAYTKTNKKKKNGK